MNGPAPVCHDDGYYSPNTPPTRPPKSVTPPFVLGSGTDSRYFRKQPDRRQPGWNSTTGCIFVKKDYCTCSRLRCSTIEKRVVLISVRVQLQSSARPARCPQGHHIRTSAACYLPKTSAAARGSRSCSSSTRREAFPRSGSMFILHASVGRMARWKGPSA